MAAKSSEKKCIEITLVKAELTGVPERALLKSRNLGEVDLIWPRTGIARKSAAREVVFKKGKVDFRAEEWAKRVVFREDIEDHCAIAVSVTEPVSIQQLKHFTRLCAKYALKMGADFVEKAMVGYADIASSPLDALAALVGEKEAPKPIAQGVLDVTALPEVGEEVEVVVPLKRPLTGKAIGSFTLQLKA